MNDSDKSEQFTNDNVVDHILSEKLIDKIPILSQISTSIEDSHPDIDVEGLVTKEINISWPNSGDFFGGNIFFKFADHFSDEGFPMIGKPRFVTSYVETNYGPLWPLQRNAIEGTSAVLSLIATLNQTALQRENGLLHVDEANYFSNPLIERMVSAGFYYFSDQYGNRIDKSISLPRGKLYACKYPINGISPKLDKFIIYDAVDLINTFSG